jgi:hypothetical protein
MVRHFWRLVQELTRIVPTSENYPSAAATLITSDRFVGIDLRLIRTIRVRPRIGEKFE